MALAHAKTKTSYLGTDSCISRPPARSRHGPRAPSSRANPPTILMTARLALVLLLFIACQLPTPATSLVGNQYVAVAVTENGRPRSLIPGGELTLAFHQSGHMNAGGCNDAIGPYQIAADRLIWQPSGTSIMGCDPPGLSAQDDWWIAFLSSEPQVVFTSTPNELVLTSGPTTVQLTLFRICHQPGTCVDL